jgi:hypothetical protein
MWAKVSQVSDVTLGPLIIMGTSLCSYQAVASPVRYMKVLCFSLKRE